ncbi:hypothetical protein B0T26DRAFT_336083 [Lasiosphaeria miniovina]|uniref:Uncharacterized protein n=1 Tax=Lasiosphaeria miniovina TaxID=1954250 RepID=A0AA40DR24_9PEZI|nr:uncharacterized protein B0T26DRAFT_336083 [Lasiosphaeria miniovina]KAK0712370.1 hypothetical protein B0T26DRAFT_336083 [Lasiosphaeria miniovina]
MSKRNGNPALLLPAKYLLTAIRHGHAGPCSHQRRIRIFLLLFFLLFLLSSGLQHPASSAQFHHRYLHAAHQGRLTTWSQVLYTGLIVAAIDAIKYGFGLNIWDVPLETEVSMQKCSFTSPVLYPSSSALLRCQSSGSSCVSSQRTMSGGNRCTASPRGLCARRAHLPSPYFSSAGPSTSTDKTIEGRCFDQPKFSTPTLP